MNKIMKKLMFPMIALFLLFFALSVIAEAGENRPDKRRRGGSYNVAEPAAVVLLGAGLVSLGIYAKRKRNK